MKDCCSKCVYLLLQYCYCFACKLNIGTEQAGTSTALNVFFWLPSLPQHVSDKLLSLPQNVCVVRNKVDVEQSCQLG